MRERATFSEREAAYILACSVRKLREWHAAGIGPRVMAAATVRYTSRALQDFILQPRPAKWPAAATPPAAPVRDNQP
jgi:hypothetical protein